METIPLSHIFYIQRLKVPGINNFSRTKSLKSLLCFHILIVSHRGTVNKLRELGIPLVPHRARQVTLDDYDKFDYIIGMDTANIRNLNRMLKHDPEGKIYKLLSFAGSGRDIADPWYTGDFDETYRDVEEGSEGFLNYLREKGKI